MTLFIQRGEHRDTQAIHAKLDELLKAQPHASRKLTRIDEEQPEEIERHRERQNADLTQLRGFAGYGSPK